MGSTAIISATQDAMEKFNDHLKPSHIIHPSSLLIEDNVLTLKQSDKLTHYMNLILKTYPQITSAYISDTTGNVIIEDNLAQTLHKHANGTSIPFTKVPPRTHYISQFIQGTDKKTVSVVTFKDIDGNILGKKNIPFDPKGSNQPWLNKTILSGTSRHIDIYPFPNKSGYGITISDPIVINNKVIGIIGIDLDMQLIENYLTEYKLSKNSISLIVDNKGNIIIYDDPQNPKKDYTLLKINQITDPVIMKAFALYQKKKLPYFTFTAKHKDYVGLFMPYALDKDNLWIVVTVLPVDDILRESNIANYNNMILCSLLILLSLIFVYYFSRKISEPIMELTNYTKHILRLDFSEPLDIKTNIYEVIILTKAFNATRRALTSFSKYVPRALVVKLIHSGQIAVVGGEKKQVSILFTDIENFTNIAEKIPAEALTQQLSNYLDEVTQIIHQNNGNVDKYIGDSVMAFWGAPFPDAEQQYHACLTALKCKERIDALNEAWKLSGDPVFVTRFGIHTGEVIVGNVGSSDRLNYTILGDAVNFASRLEAANKVYDTKILVSEAIYTICKDFFEFRELPSITVKGKSDVAKVYELISVIMG